MMFQNNRPGSGRIIPQNRASISSHKKGSAEALPSRTPASYCRNTCPRSELFVHRKPKVNVGL